LDRRNIGEIGLRHWDYSTQALSDFTAICKVPLLLTATAD
jgi:hypothetical protein